MDPQALRQGPITLTAFEWVPSFAQGHVRDLRLRWALEEAGLPYEAVLLAQGEQREAANLARQPFGQVPALQVGDRSLFKTGACLLRIAEASEALLPARAAERDACLAWLFAAVDSVEKPISMLAMLRIFVADKEAAARVEPDLKKLLAERLGRLADALGSSEHLVADRFTIADLAMTMVLRDAEDADLGPFPTLRAYVARHMARPAFARALADQLAPFAENAARYERPAKAEPTTAS